MSKKVKVILILTETDSASRPAIPMLGLPERSNLERASFSGRHSAIAMAAAKNLRLNLWYAMPPAYPALLRYIPSESSSLLAKLTSVIVRFIKRANFRA
jgi:hypothetical protein